MGSATLPPRPVAAAAIATAAATAFFAAPNLVGCGRVGAALAAIVAAALTAATWPRFATDTLGLHGTIFPVPAGPGDWPILGRAAQFKAAVTSRQLCLLYADWRAAAGARNFAVWTAGARRIWVTHPEDVRYVMARVNPPRDVKLLAPMGLVISPNMLLLTAGESHTRTRRLLQGPLNRDVVLAMAVRVVLADVGGPTGRFGAALAAAAGGGAAAAGDDVGSTDGPIGGSPLRFDDLCEQLTLSVIHQVLVSAPVPDQVFVDKIHSALPLTMAAMGVPAPKLLARRAVARLRAVGDYFVVSYTNHEAARRAAYADGSWDPNPPKDVLDVLLADIDEPKGAYRGDRIRLAADFMLFLSAGYDTTVCVERWSRCGGVACMTEEGASAALTNPAQLLLLYLSLVGPVPGSLFCRRGSSAVGVRCQAHSIEWGILTLCRHPETQDRLLAEARNVLGCPPTTAAADLPITPTTLTRMPILHAVWKEVIRLYPPTAGGPSRRPVANLTLPSDGSVIPAGTAIKLSQYVVLHDEEAYPDPYAFCPDRWLPTDAAGRAAAKAAEVAWAPFGTGPVSCPGRRLSELEWKTTVVCTLWGYRLGLAWGEPVRGLDLVTLRPTPFGVRVTRRSATP